MTYRRSHVPGRICTLLHPQTCHLTHSLTYSLLPLSYLLTYRRSHVPGRICACTIRHCEGLSNHTECTQATATTVSSHEVVCAPLSSPPLLTIFIYIIHTYTHTYMHTCIHICIHYIYIYMHTYVDTSTFSPLISCFHLP